MCFSTYLCIAPLNAQNQTVSTYGLSSTKYIETSTHGTVESFKTTGSTRDYAEVAIGTTLGLEIKFRTFVDISQLTAVMHLIYKNTPIPVIGKDPDLGKVVVLPIKAGDRRTAFINIVFPSIYPRINCSLQIDFIDNTGKDIVSLTCALKIK